VPHLSEIQKKYEGKVNVIGLNIWEEPKATSNSYFYKIDDYIADFGDKLAFSIAADGYEGKMAKAWMEASEGQGIPTSFIVGKDGTVLWIGHPQAGLDQALDQILAGTYDLAGAAAKDKARRDNAKASREAYAPITNAMKAGDTKAAIAAIDAAIAKNPKLELNLGMTKYNLQLKSDVPAAMVTAKQLAEGAAKDMPNALNAIAWPMVDDAAPIKGADYGLAVKIAERGVSITKENDPFYAFIADTLAYAYFKNNQLDKAIETEGKAIKAAESQKEFPADTLKELKDRMEMFKKKKGGG